MELYMYLNMKLTDYEFYCNLLVYTKEGRRIVKSQAPD